MRHARIIVAALLLVTGHANAQTSTGKQTVSDLSELRVKPRGAATSGALADHVAGVVNVSTYLRAPYVAEPYVAGTTNATAAIQAALDAASALGGAEVFAPKGTYLISDTLSVASNVTLRGAGDATVLKLSIAAGAFGTSVTNESKAAITLLSVTGAGLRDLKIDGQGATRPASVALSQTVVLSGAQHCLVEGVTFYDVGQSSFSPSGPALLLLSQDIAGDWTDPGPKVIGASRYNVVRRCKFILPSAAKYAFAIRIDTNFLAVRPLASFVNRSEYNVVEDCYFSGNWNWNHIEIAGGGAVHNKVVGNYFTGSGLTAIDLDKAASYNFISGNTIENFKKVDYVGDTSRRFTALHDHGSGTDYVNVGNVFAGNFLHNIDGNADIGWPSAMGMEHVSNSTFSNNVLDGMTNTGGTLGYGFYLGYDVNDSAIQGNTILNSLHGLWLNTSDAGLGARMRISGNTISSVDRAISLEGLSGSIEGYVISENVLRTSNAAKYPVFLGPTFSAPMFLNNDVGGGIDGVYNGALLATLSGNTVRNAAQRSFRHGSTATLPIMLGNRSVTPGSGDYIVTAGGDEPTLIGNAFSQASTFKSGPRIMWGTAAPTTGTWSANDRVINIANDNGLTLEWVCTIGGTPGTWRPTGYLPSVSGDRGDANVTLTVGSGTADQTQRFATTLTANRTVTLSTTGAFKGASWRIVRTGLGAFTLDVGGLKTIPSATAAFVDVAYNGTAWVLTGYGLL